MAIKRAYIASLSLLLLLLLQIICLVSSPLLLHVFCFPFRKELFSAGFHVYNCWELVEFASDTIHVSNGTEQGL